MGIASGDGVHDTYDASRFDDAEDGAMPLERPHAPNCFDARKLMRKKSSDDRYADLSSSNDGEKTPNRFSSIDSDANRETVPLAVPSRDAKVLHEQKSGLAKQDHLGPEDAADMSTTRDFGMIGIFSNWFRFRTKKDQNTAQTLDDANGTKLNEYNPMPGLSTKNLAPDQEPVTKMDRTSHVGRGRKSKIVIFSGLHSVLIEACSMILLFISTVYRSLMSIMTSPFRHKKYRNLTASRRSEMNIVGKKNTNAEETIIKTNTSADGSIEDRGASSSSRTESEELVVEREESMLSSGNSTLSSSRGSYGDLESTTAQGENAHVSDLKVSGTITCSEQMPLAKTDGTETKLARIGESSSDLPSTAIRSSSSETTNTEDSDEHLWQRVQTSGQWTDDAEQTIRRATFAGQERLSPVSQENITKTHPHSSNHVLGSTQRDNVHSNTQENALQGIRGTRAVRPPTQRYQKRNSSFEAHRSLEHPNDLYYRESGFSSTDKRRDSFTSQEPDVYGPERFRRELYEPDGDQYLSPFSVQYHEPMYVPEIRRKHPLRKGVIGDVKAMTDSLFRVFAKNKPEPDTRFTSPRSAHKTMALIADLMVKEFNCMVAVRRNGALKLRCEKHYSLNRMLRARVTFQELDIFSCNVVIARSRADNFTVPTADYVNFVAGLQQALLNNISGSERYQ
ncbi:hypothetical protein BWQ96_03866 [Gracilariopsis chorda]|uniref:Uncharacterized protein n=1 Tax=Gracilariopsis chorda TaxID=448386 RepID=A0A2V3IXE8_9FLOR|nr:hypothetical protein BWQ96_03866 [Gracilariopsis chorda]|eukprot:PXF46367.1 hypothetical protein BWQ96_03866 [Gracilariopsis chorda]